MTRKVSVLLCAALTLSLLTFGAGGRPASARPVAVKHCVRTRHKKLGARTSRARRTKAPVSTKRHKPVLVRPCVRPAPVAKTLAPTVPSSLPAGRPAGVAPALPSAPTPATPAAPSGGESSPDPPAGVQPALNPFSPTSFWNAPLADAAPLDANSQAYVNELVRQVHTYGTWLNTASYSVPLYVVGPDQATQRVTLDVRAPDLQAEWAAVPIPSGAQAAAGTDEHMTIWQPSTDRLWEFWKMQLESDGWHARWGGEMDNVSTNPGYFTHSGLTNDWGATATSLPLLGGLITQGDLERGYINHALAISLVEAAPRCWSWPAQRTDGAFTTAGITAIPEGTRFRLDPALNIAGLNLPPIGRMLAEAAQKYGIVVRDKGGDVALYGQDPKSMSTNLWPQEFPGTYPSVVLAQFPWSHLQVLQTSMSCSGS
jgi:hypothetical protein